MKKKLLIAALVTALVLLTGTIVGFAVEAANKNAEAQAAEKAAAKAAEKQANIDKTMQELGVSSDSEAGEVLLSVLQEKEMTRYDMELYLKAGEEIRKMDHAQIMAKLEEYKDIDETLAKMPFSEAMKIQGFADRLAQKLMYEQYADAIAVGEPLYEQYHKALSDYHVYGLINDGESLERFKKKLEEKPDSHILQRSVLVLPERLKVWQLSGDMLKIFETKKANGTNITLLTKDMKDIYDFLGSELCYLNNPNNLIVERDYSYIVTRYLAGESVEDIVG